MYTHMHTHFHNSNLGGEDSKLFENGSVRDRELFMAFNIDTHPASLFRCVNVMGRLAKML